MNNFIIGLTGGIGSGKTAISNWFYEQGIDVIDADNIAHQITQKDNPILDDLKKAFGDWVIDINGNYNRSQMRQYIFHHNDELKKLNAIMHPAIRQEIIKQLNSSRSPYCILSVPLLFESYKKDNGLMPLCQHFLVIDVDEKTQLQRASQRDNTSTATIQAIIDKQISREHRLHLARQLGADIISNFGTLNELHTKLPPLHEHYLRLATKH